VYTVEERLFIIILMGELSLAFRPRTPSMFRGFSLAVGLTVFRSMAAVDQFLPGREINAR